MRTAALVPARQAAPTIAPLVQDLCGSFPSSEGRAGVIVVDDGSTDGTAEAARTAGALVVSHGRNQGKGAAIRTGLRVARDLELDAVVALSAHGQHVPEQARMLADHPCDPRALVLGVRDLRGAGAGRTTQVTNRISNFLLSVVTGRVLADTQCGMRRYPVRETLTLDARDDGYGFDAEVLLLALRSGLPVVEVPILLGSPSRSNHFRVVRDPARIVARVIYTLGRQKPGLIRLGEAHPLGDPFSRRG